MTLSEIDAILRNAINQIKGVQKAETLEAAKERATGAGTLIKKARAALAEVVAVATNPEPESARAADRPDGG